MKEKRKNIVESALSVLIVYLLIRLLFMLKLT